MHTAFFLLLGASLARFLLRHPGEPRTPWVIALGAALLTLYALGPVLGPQSTDCGPQSTDRGPHGGSWSPPPPSPPSPSPPSPSRAGRPPLPGRFGAVVVIWVVLVLLAPSFAWCAVPLFYTGLRTLPVRAALLLVALLTAFVVGAQLRLAGGFDPYLLLAPPAVAAIATAVFLHMERQAARQRALIDDLIRTREELAATERREGTLAERQRLSMEIHDTLAQGLSSQQMLLQAADRTWADAPETARRHVRTATEIAARNLAEARRFVHDLAPAELAGGVPLHEALRLLAARERGPGLEVRFHLDGAPAPLPDRVQSALLRIAQGALANVREHSGATTAAVTLSFLGDQVVLDVADDGRGFDTAAGGPRPVAEARPAGETRPAGAARPVAGRGHGLPAMRARAAQLGGALTIESAPGEGTVLSAALPWSPPYDRLPLRRRLDGPARPRADPAL
ncbi:sensor histidine kinase [Streptomyces sp. XD-27]|uniref:sensor histidine kinase n=1 Tax=Streptomyces sp. XD-27 TaxID=3062779 RepID=UPI0026F467D9|nr:sensor histidine kinase [Streptomyces sp. XD-27]WKX74133.1 sensor histidine kinase [Streptomyces sp. XD-27]